MSCFCLQDIGCFFPKETTKTMNDGDIKHLTNDGRSETWGHVSSRITGGDYLGVCHLEKSSMIFIKLYFAEKLTINKNKKLANVHEKNPTPGPPPKKMIEF